MNTRSGLIPAVRPKNYKEKPYILKLKSQVDGSAKVEHALTQIMGVGRKFAQAVVLVAGIDPNMRIGAISEKDLNRIEEIIVNPIENGIPSNLVNRKNDPRQGLDKHIVQNQLNIITRRDIERMIRMRSFQSMRHKSIYRLKVKGLRSLVKKEAIPEKKFKKIVEFIISLMKTRDSNEIYMERKYLSEFINNKYLELKSGYMLKEVLRKKLEKSDIKTKYHKNFIIFTSFTIQ